MSDISAWLQDLGLGKYAKTFEDNEIDFDALPHLTESMLKQIGLPVGPRAKVLAAMRDLQFAATSGVKRQQNLAGEVAGEPRGERRQVTVMFCDLVDSTKLARDLDPEDLGSVMQAYQKSCGAIIARYEGSVSQYRGDGVEAIFGWPMAHEDAAERAVRAGLEVVDAVKTVLSPQPLSVRVGISTGIIVTGLDGLSALSGVVGEPFHVASRLQTLATPNSVVIAETTRRLVSARFDEEDLGLQALKGIATPMRAFRIHRLRQDTTRFHTMLARPMTPLVGREAELAFLAQRWRDAASGEGQTIFLSGVPGMGKSRIVHELEKAIEHEPHLKLGLQCLPHCMQSPLYPVIQQIERLAGLTPDDPDGVKLDKIEGMVAPATDQVGKVAPLIAEMMSVPLLSRYAPLAATAQQVKLQTLLAIGALLFGLSEKLPVLCVFEDAQWIDPSTQELLDLVLGQIENHRILLIVTHRPEYQIRSTSHNNVSGLTITRLPRRDVIEMARLVLGERQVSTAMMLRIVDESDSIPLFVEELARGAVEAGGTEKRIDPPAPGLVPDTLRDSLVARLDRAPHARNVAQMAAAIGREFSYDMLLRISSLSASQLDSTLAHLRQSEIIQVVDDRLPARYVFKHALVRDAAYESLLRSSRKEIHAKIASILEEEWPEIVAGQPELLAYHYSLAGKAEFAARHWLVGGRRARSRSANREAILQFQKALEFLDLLPETPERLATELEIQLSLGLCFIAVDGYSAEETRASFERARTLSVEISKPDREIQAIYGLWGHHWMRASHDHAIELAQTLLAKAELAPDPTVRTVAHRCIGSTLFTFGDFDGARQHLEKAIASGRDAAAEKSSLAFAVDPAIAAQLILAWNLWIIGYPEQARDHALAAHRRATRRGDPYSVAFAEYVTSAVRLLRGELERSLVHADRSFTLAKDHGINLYALYARFGRGCALAKMGHKAQAILEIREGIEEARRSNLGYMRGFMLGWLAATQAETGDPDLALATIDDALKQVSDVVGRAWEAELRRLRGDILLLAHADAVAAAEQSYSDAIETARRQGARSLELRAATSLAQLLRRLGRNEEARERLVGIFSQFTEGFDTADLKEAKALLDELARG